MMIISSLNVNLIRVKADLLCYGIRISKDALQEALTYYPSLLEEKFIHNAHLMLEKGLLVNVCIGEDFARRSPYEIILEDQQLCIVKGSKKCSMCSIIPEPKWYEKKTKKGIEMSRIFRQHGIQVLADTTYSRCDFINSGERCLFCSFPLETIDEAFKISQVGEIVFEALKENPDYSVALSEGGRKDTDSCLNYFIKVIKEIRRISSRIPISVELVPPENCDALNILIDSGATALIMNLELFDDNLRTLMCPGKGKIGKDIYRDAWNRAISLLGRGKASSVLIAGIEDKHNTIKSAMEMINLGVIPTIIPFRPYNNCYLKNMHLANPQDLIKINSVIGKEIKEAGLDPMKQGGCTSCGACSIERELFYVENNVRF